MSISDAERNDGRSAPDRPLPPPDESGFDNVVALIPRRTGRPHPPPEPPMAA